MAGVSRSCLIRSSNSVGRTGTGSRGRPQLGFPRLRVISGKIGESHHTPLGVCGDPAKSQEFGKSIFLEVFNCEHTSRYFETIVFPPLEEEGI